MSKPSAIAATATGRRRSHLYNRFHIVGAFLFGCCFASFAMTFFHFTALSTFHDHDLSSSSSSSSKSTSVHQHLNFAENKRRERITQQQHQQQRQQQQQQQDVPQQESKPGAAGAVAVVGKNLAANHNNLVHPVAGLDCSEHDGPNRMEDAQEMAYWRDIQPDNSWTSPFLKKNTRQYLTFEPDGGGWNNIRMSMGTLRYVGVGVRVQYRRYMSFRFVLLCFVSFRFVSFLIRIYNLHYFTMLYFWAL